MLYLNGQLMPADMAAVTVTDRGFTLGDGLFETIKAKAGRPLRLDAHMERLQAGAAILRLELPLDQDGVAAAIAQVLEANGLTDAALRLTVSRGPGVRGLLPPKPAHPTVLLTAGPLPPAMGPARLVVAHSTRRNEHSALSRCKALSYLDNILARMEAEDRDGDDALLLNTGGLVAETTIANLFMVTADGTMVTPPVESGALPGVRRAELLRQLPVIERPVVLDEVLSAQEVFLTNALSIRAVASVDGHPISDGQPGPLTRRLLDGMDSD
ncbi:MAG: aminotransferase class IV family protein [Rhodospirillaceae bacterium]|nr:aminotransferase class IV family protein [Rhodospirillales bacterium]